MIGRIKRQSISKTIVLVWNVFRMTIIKLIYGNKVSLSVIQNIFFDTVISVKNGHMALNHSVFTRKGVTFRAEGGELIIGTSFFNQGCSVTAKKRIVIGNDCLFGPNVVIVDHDHDYTCNDNRRGIKYLLSDVIIGNNVVVGANTVILKGTKIGDNCMIGAGSIVSGTIPPNTIYYSENKPYMKAIHFKEN